MLQLYILAHYALHSYKDGLWLLPSRLARNLLCLICIGIPLYVTYFHFGLSFSLSVLNKDTLSLTPIESNAAIFCFISFVYELVFVIALFNGTLLQEIFTAADSEYKKMINGKK